MNGEKNLMWSASGNKGQKWNYANVLVGDNRNFTVVFEGTQGARGTSDLSLDEVSFTPECATGRKFTLIFTLLFYQRWKKEKIIKDGYVDFCDTATDNSYVKAMKF